MAYATIEHRMIEVTFPDDKVKLYDPTQEEGTLLYTVLASQFPGDHLMSSSSLDFPSEYGLSDEAIADFERGVAQGAHYAVAVLMDAIAFASVQHAGQFSRDGSQYIRHPLTVMYMVEPFGFLAQAVAVLHDVVEDTDASLDDVAERFGPLVAEGVDYVTRRISVVDAKKERYHDGLIARAAAHPIGRIVKRADVMHHLARAEGLNAYEVEKYERALVMLGGNPSSSDDD